MESLIDETSVAKSSSRSYTKFVCGVIFITFAVATTLLVSRPSKISSIYGSWKNVSMAVVSMVKPSSISNDRSTEIAISYFPRQAHQRFSKFRCTGAENDIGASDGRLCVFNNLCYSTLTDRFYYYRLSENHTRPLFYDASKRMLYQFSEKNDGQGFLSLSAGGGTSWAPIVTNQAYPMKDVTTLHQLHSLMQVRFADENIAHGLWEDFGSISYSMERLNLVDPDMIIMHYGKLSQGSLTSTYNRYVIPALSPKPMVQLDQYAKSFNTTYICFKQVMAGGQLSVFPKPTIRENHGREALFYSWRSKIIQYNGFDPNFVPKRHHVIITNKSKSIWTRPGAKRHRSIVNLQEVAEFVQKTYPNITSEVIEWHTVPFNQQIEKLLNTTILITPCGGVSLIIPFLPHGAHAIVTDFYTNQPAHGFSVGQSGSMEGAFLNHVPHVRKQYYQLYGPEDFEFDFPGASNSREDASVIVNITRLHVLMDKALEEMEP